MLLSIVVPVLDEERGIADALAVLQPLRAAGHEIIVVDGGSRDRTLALATPLADRAFCAPRGRASQMNAGAALAHHDTLLFLHADTRRRSTRSTRSRVRCTPDIAGAGSTSRSKARRVCCRWSPQ
jgi:glycosyltransferase involved in cell wall biosynthesis